MSNYHRWMYLLSELCFAFLGCGRHHVTLTGSRKSIQSSLEPLHRDDRQVFGSCVFRTVDQGSKWKTQGSPEFCTGGPTMSSLRHLECQKGTKRKKTLYYFLIGIFYSHKLVAWMVKNLPAMQETRVWSLGWENPLGKGMATHSSVLAWRIPRTAEPGGLQSMGSPRVRHNLVNNSFTFFFLWSCGFIGEEIVCKLNNSARIVFVRMCVGKGWGIFASFYPYPALSQECCGEKLPVFPGSHWWDGTPLASTISPLFCSS